MTSAARKAGFVMKHAVELSKYFVVDLIGVVRDAGYAILAAARRRLH